MDEGTATGTPTTANRGGRHGAAGGHHGHNQFQGKRPLGSRRVLDYASPVLQYLEGRAQERDPEDAGGALHLLPAVSQTLRLRAPAAYLDNPSTSFATRPRLRCCEQRTDPPSTARSGCRYQQGKPCPTSSTSPPFPYAPATNPVPCRLCYLRGLLSALCPVPCGVSSAQTGRRLLTGTQMGEFCLLNGVNFHFDLLYQAHENGHTHHGLE